MFSRIRAIGQWLFNSVVEAAEWEAFDENLSNAIDGKDGGAYAPTDPIEFGGAGISVEEGIGNYPVTVTHTSSSTGNEIPDWAKFMAVSVVGAGGAGGSIAAGNTGAGGGGSGYLSRHVFVVALLDSATYDVDVAVSSAPATGGDASEFTCGSAKVAAGGGFPGQSGGDGGAGHAGGGGGGGGETTNNGGDGGDSTQSGSNGDGLGGDGGDGRIESVPGEYFGGTGGAGGVPAGSYGGGGGGGGGPLGDHELEAAPGAGSGVTGGRAGRGYGAGGGGATGGQGAKAGGAGAQGVILVTFW